LLIYAVSPILVPVTEVTYSDIKYALLGFTAISIEYLCSNLIVDIFLKNPSSNAKKTIKKTL